METENKNLVQRIFEAVKDNKDIVSLALGILISSHIAYKSTSGYLIKNNILDYVEAIAGAGFLVYGFYNLFRKK